MNLAEKMTLYAMDEDEPALIVGSYEVVWIVFEVYECDIIIMYTKTHICKIIV